MTQKELADIVGVDRSVISKYENGLMVPHILILKKMAEVFGCTVDELVGEWTKHEKEEILK